MWLLLAASALCFASIHSQYYLRDQTVGCDGMLGSGKRLDRCGECGGDNTTCRVISGIFTKRTSKAAYEYITEFPKGAESINITEARNTRNYLALRYSSTNQSILNGNWSLTWAGEHDVAGTKLVYKKPRQHGVGETIYIQGPLQEEITLLLLVQTRNPGIYYHYILPVRPKVSTNSAAAHPVDNYADLPKYVQDSLGRLRSPSQQGYVGVTYQWRVLDDGGCSEPCGEGLREQRVVCVLVSSKATVTEENCPSLQRPQPEKILCNTQPCSPRWETDTWSECSATCGHSTQTRSVTCRRRISSIESESVSAVNCDSTKKPSTVRMCSNIQMCHTWKHSGWSKCSAQCGSGSRQRVVNCVNGNGGVVDDRKCSLDKPRDTERCYSSCDTTWFYSDWLNTCNGCGRGDQTRELFCPADEESYSSLRTSSLCGSPPNRVQACESRSECRNLGSWFTGAWSDCEGSCEEAYQRRHVFCMAVEHSNYEKLEDSQCIGQEKPTHKQKCQKLHCNQSTSLWMTTDWSECSVSCGEGHQRRRVMCLNKDRKEDNSCLQDIKPPTVKNCATPACPIIQQYVDSSCTDKYRSCHVVVQARLCKLSYYNNICCNSCRITG
ncbi:thrombospondin type-1 domain-containing protein 4-like [Watersipora subatra]|uniref:thrombospondin type-1 domain-containing protein 4-like n=1 Tax=Watersipora subatra TaxID=2589382 RepID=UPI00355BF488